MLRRNQWNFLVFLYNLNCLLKIRASNKFYAMPTPTNRMYWLHHRLLLIMQMFNCIILFSKKSHTMTHTLTCVNNLLYPWLLKLLYPIIMRHFCGTYTYVPLLFGKKSLKFNWQVQRSGRQKKRKNNENTILVM